MQIKGIFFDLDGTLVDSNDLHILAGEEAFADIGRPFDRQVLHEQIGKGTDMLVSALLLELDAAAVEALGKAHGSMFESRYLDRVEPFAQARALLAHVHDRGQQVVRASSTSQADIDHDLGLLDARKLMAATTSNDDVERTKPAPDIFAVALAKLRGVDAEAIIVVGDTPYDMEAANRCGIAAVAVRSGGFANDILWNAGAIAIYDDATALLRDHDASPLGR